MDLLTKSLLEDLLDTKKTVAIYGGGFKPPTKGHFTVAKKTLEDFPEIDELKIFVGSGVRDGITQDESIKIWDIYKKYLSPKVDVEASVAPVKSVLGYAKENPDTKVYWILGAREGEEGDLKDIESRTKSLSKYPNLEVKVITTSGGVSGTKTRAAIRSGNKEQFFHLTPDINDEEKEQIWNFVEPIIQENYLTSIKDKFTKFISAVKQEGKETKEAVSLLIKAAKGDIELSNEQKEQIGHQLKDVLKLIGLTAIAALPGGFVAGALIKLFKAESLITPSAFVNEVGEANLKPYKWEEIDQEGYYVYTRFVTDSETQYDVDIKTTVFFPAGQMESLPALEIEFSAKPKGAEGSSAKIVVNKGEMYKVMATIVDIIKKYIKKSKARAIIYSPSKKSSEEYFGTQRDQLYRAFISKAIPGVTFKQSGDFVTAILPNTTLNEGKQVGTLYHYTSAAGLKSILQSNRINASEESYNYEDQYFVSFTRNKNFHKRGMMSGVKTEYRITLDGNKLSNKYKIQPFAYEPGHNYEESWQYDWLKDEPESVRRDFFNATGDYDEQEERIFFKNENGGIDNIKNYILAVDKVEDLQENLIQETMTVYRLGEIPYDEDSFFVTPDYKTWIKYYPGEEIHKITTNKLYLPLRNKSFSSFDELRSKYEKGEFTEDDVAYINPEESGIQHFEQYEIRPDDIIDLEQINLQEGRKKKPDPKKGTGKKPEGSGRRLYTDEDPKDTVSIKFKTKEDIVDTLNKKSFKAKPHARQSQIINVIHQRVRAAYSKAKDPEVKSRLKRALDYIESRKESSKKKTERLRKMKEASDPQAGTALPYGSGFAPVKENDFFGLNEYAKTLVKEALIETWNPKESFVSLSQYMIDNGMNIKPLPKIKVIKDDEQNASDLLGKTAYYNPVEKSITLYTMDRHPKDILRSFAHEMVHHEQNLNGKLGSINTTNTNEDGDLLEIEKEAYEKGNIMLRNWEDKIKNV